MKGRVSDPDLRKLIRSLKAQGFEVSRTKKGHVMVKNADGERMVMPSTPSEFRGRKNALAALRRMGYDDERSGR